jgi:hypothetical protein
VFVVKEGDYHIAQTRGRSVWVPAFAGTTREDFVIACDKREAFAQGSEATKQSILAALLPYGLLCGACHRARIRATR